MALTDCQREVKDKMFFILLESDLKQEFQCRAYHHGQSSLYKISVLMETRVEVLKWPLKNKQLFDKAS